MAIAKSWNRYILRQPTNCTDCGSWISAGDVCVERHGYYRCLPCHSTAQNKSYMSHGKRRSAVVNTGYSAYMKGVAMHAQMRVDALKHPKDKTNYGFVECGTAPKHVQCACFGFPGYRQRAAKEIGKWIPHLVSYFGETPTGCGFYEIKIDHKVGGAEYTVRFYYDKSSIAGSQYADRVRDGLPNTWGQKFKPEGIDEDYSTVHGGWERRLVKLNDFRTECAKCHNQSSIGNTYHFIGGYKDDVGANEGALCDKCFPTRDIIDVSGDTWFAARCTYKSQCDYCGRIIVANEIYRHSKIATPRVACTACFKKKILS